MADEDGGGATLLADWAAHREAVNRRQVVSMPEAGELRDSSPRVETAPRVV